MKPWQAVLLASIARVVAVVMIASIEMVAGPGTSDSLFARSHFIGREVFDVSFSIPVHLFGCRFIFVGHRGELWRWDDDVRPGDIGTLVDSVVVRGIAGQDSRGDSRGLFSNDASQ